MRTLAEVLDELASHEFDMPRFFAEKGIKGFRERCHDCPVAIYILRETGATCVDVFTADSRIILPDHSAQWVDNPPAVANFIKSFDAGEHPELDAAPNSTGDN